LTNPTYLALLGLGKAVKTVFLCKYLHSEELHREINEGLNVRSSIIMRLMFSWFIFQC